MVYLVGAGPGDPGLITVRGQELLGRAEVVVYDYLANPALLSLCSQARLIYVGKKAADHAMTQEQINQVLVEEAKRGRVVVRLKGGDPFVFGRGGEECLALREAGVAFEVVPGITSAIAAAAYAGIPVTHRDFNSSFTIITGHEKEETYQDPHAQARSEGEASDLNWSALAKLPCLAFYMGVKALPRICARLMEHGMPADTAAACIRWGTMPQQRSVVGTIADLPEKVAAAGLKPPAITIIGRVVELHDDLNWFERRPLFGQTVVVTRTRQQASELSLKLAELGARVIEAPTIELKAAESPEDVDAALRQAASYDWVIFTSANGVEYARTRLEQLGLDARAFGPARLAAIGEATAQAIRQRLSLRVDCLPTRFVAEALADELAAQDEVRGKRFLLLRADIARPVLRERLAADGAACVEDVAIYQTLLPEKLPEELVEALEAKEVQWITFTSSSTVRNFVQLLGADRVALLKGVKLASIGPITTQTLNELGLPPTVEAKQFDIEGLVEAMASR